MTKQSEKFIELFQVILDENGYYINLKKKGFTASELYWQYEDCESRFPIYNYLDSIENFLEHYNTHPIADVSYYEVELYQIIDELWDRETWVYPEDC